MEEELEEAQQNQMIGQTSPLIDAVAAEGQGWGGSPPLSGPGLAFTQRTPEKAAHQQTDASDYSARGRRANDQARGWEQGLGTALNPPKPMLPPGQSGSMAAQQVTPIAALPPTNQGGNS